MTEPPMIDHDESKRGFLKLILSGGLIALVGTILYPIIAYLKPPKQGEVQVSSVSGGKLSAIEKESGTIVKFGTKPVLLVRTETGEVRAFSAICTHLDCTVQYKKEMGVIWCACHNGKYDLNGRNIAGPPPRPLDEYRVTIEGDDVLISKAV